MSKNLIFIICFVLTLGLSACQPHRIDIQQGNKIKPETMSKLKVGMSASQVVFLLGTPLLKDPFHQDRWDYIYYLKPGNKQIKQSRVTLYFNNDMLIKIDDSAYAPEQHEDETQADIGSEETSTSISSPSND